MKKLIPILLLAISLSACSSFQKKDNLELNSPNSELQISFFLTENNTATYTVMKENELIIDTSTLAFVLKNAPELRGDLSIVESKISSFDENWEPIWGENKVIKNNYNELRVHLQENNELAREFFVVFKVYDDGLGFRFEFPEQENLNDVIILDEQTQFHLTNDHTAWWIPADFDSYEYHYTKSKVSEINAADAGYEQRHDRHSNNLKAVNTPVTLKTNSGIYLSFHEANLTNYSGMTLAVKDNYILQSELVPALDGNTVKVKTPFVTPWRTIQITETAGDLINSNLIVNLNEPNVLENTSWIKPMKYNGVWWEIHIGKSSWDYGTGKHGANTANTKKYIDFASKNDLKGVLVEGWNIGWKDWGDKTFDFTQPYPDFDIEEIVRYGKKKGVELIGHHETFGNVGLYDSIVEDAFKYYSDLGIHNIKTGYAAGLLPKHFHHSQFMVNHYRKVVELAAKYEINVDAHEPIKATGIRRTYPNMMTREGVKGMEYNAWGDGNPPSHTTIIPFTRGLGGPMDYTPGIFDIKFKSEKPDQYVRTTLAKQLALFVVLYSPMQMAADLPENYEKHQAYNFIRDVAADWDKSIILNGEIGEYVSVARKEKNTENWFIGSITNEDSRDLIISLDFLEEGKQYVAKIYADDENAHWAKNPTLYTVKQLEVNRDSKLNLSLVAGGGCAISIHLNTNQNK
jgi:alpha-glucosidase